MAGRKMRLNPDYVLRIAFFFLIITFFMNYLINPRKSGPSTTKHIVDSSQSSMMATRKKTNHTDVSMSALPPTLEVTLDPNKPGQFIFVAGLEGSGHHMYSSVWDKCSECIFGSNVNKLLHNQISNKKVSGIFAGIDPVTVEKESHLLVQKMETMANMHRGKNIIINTWKDTPASGEMSYPNFIYPYRFVQHPHILNLANQARKADVPLKFLVLIRSGPAMIKSTTINRKFEEIQKEIKILENMCQELRYTLMVIGHEYYGCIDYDDHHLGVESTGRTLGFDGRSFEKVINSEFHASSNKDPSQVFSMQELAFMEPLNECMSNLRSLCFR